ncbi:hypothetical protein MVEN_02400600 [Mycena venus]|uniref:Uncharacterized protein n=1 Tax=Mycena venus TaxID=2733690 RepID=A0A8H6X2E5_9AGAR|nr:hypothetical protein MVEN_02400600 [Mycena venus]
MRTSTAALFLLATLVVQLARGDIINNNNGGSGTTNNNNNNGGGGNIINNNNGAPDPRCQPFATNGAALESSSEGDGLLLCLYDGAGACPYSLTDGSSVAKGLVCPPSLTQDPGSSSASETSASLGGGVSRSASLTTASPSGNAGPSGSASPSGHANSSGHASASDTTNGLPTVSSSSSTEISSPQGISTSLPPLGAASAKKRIPAGAVAGVVVAALLVGLILALLIRRRCLQRRAAERRAMQIRHQTLTISPFELINQRDDSDTIGPVVAASRGHKRKRRDSTATRNGADRCAGKDGGSGRCGEKNSKGFGCVPKFGYAVGEKHASCFDARQGGRGLRS